MQVGNALLDYYTFITSPGEYYWSHGLISDADYQLFTKVCNGSEIRSSINREVSTACYNASEELYTKLTSGIDLYGVISDVCLSPVKSQIDKLHEPLLSRIQNLSSLHSKLEALSQQVKFTHHWERSYCDVFIIFFVVKTQPFLPVDFNWLVPFLPYAYSNLKWRNWSVEKASHKNILTGKMCRRLSMPSSSESSNGLYAASNNMH